MLPICTDQGVPFVFFPGKRVGLQWLLSLSGASLEIGWYRRATACSRVQVDEKVDDVDTLRNGGDKEE